MRLEVRPGAAGNARSWNAGERPGEEHDRSRGQTVDEPVELSLATKTLRPQRSPEATLRNSNPFESDRQKSRSTSYRASTIFKRSQMFPVMVSELSSPQPSPIITVSNLVKQFGRFAALRGVTAEFAPGRLYALLGDNGAGKTTLLRTLAGLARPTG